MSESKDRAALRAIAGLWLDDALDAHSAMRICAATANAALAQPDPVVALVEALRKIEKFLADGLPLGRNQKTELAAMARAALKAATGE